MQKNTKITDLFNSIVKQENEAVEFGFYWDNIDQILEQIKSECIEVKEAQLKNDPKHLREEVGDLILATINLCVFLNQDPYKTLQESFKKMQQRYDTMVNLVKQEGLENLLNEPMKIKLSYWKKAKEAIKHYETNKK